MLVNKTKVAFIHLYIRIYGRLFIFFEPFIPYYMVFLLNSFHFVSAMRLTFQHGIQFSFYHLLAQRRQMVDEHLTVQMVKLMLHYTSKITFHDLVMLHQVLIQIFHTYFIASFSGCRFYPDSPRDSDGI